MAVGSNSDPIPYQGFTKSLFLGLAGTVNDVVKAAGGNPVAIGQIFIENTSGATAYVQIFDALAANVTLGTTRPDIEVPIATASSINIQFPTAGGTFPNGCSVASTTASEGSSGSSAGVRVTIFWR